MATNDVAVSNPLAALTQLLQLAGGTKTTSSTQADTSALQNVLAQLQGSNDYSALLQQIFQQAATQIPKLNAAYANASGGRTQNNAGAQAALEKLLSSTTTGATELLAKLQLQNQAQQAQVASGIAQGSQRQTQQSGVNTGKAAQTLATVKALSTVAPYLKKAAGVLGIGDTTGSADGLSYSPNATLSAPANSANALGSFDLGSSNFGSGGLDLSGLDFGSGGSFGSGLDLGSFGGLSSGVDPFAGISFGGGGFDLGSFGSDLSFGVPADSFSLGSEAAGSSLPSSLSSYTPFLSAAQYLTNPSKIGDAFKLGEGNVFGDAAQIAGLGATIGGVGGALGASLGGLSALAPTLGPVGLALSFAAAAFGQGNDPKGAAGRLADKVFNQNKSIAIDDAGASNFDKVWATSLLGKYNEYADVYSTIPDTLRNLGSELRTAQDNVKKTGNIDSTKGGALSLLNNPNYANYWNDADRVAAFFADNQNNTLGRGFSQDQIDADFDRKLGIYGLTRDSYMSQLPEQSGWRG